MWGTHLSLTVLVMGTLAACVDGKSDDAPAPGVVIAGGGVPIAYAQVVYSDEGGPVAIGSADGRGRLNISGLPDRATELHIGAKGFATVRVPVAGLQGVISLAADATGKGPAGGLAFEAAVNVVCPQSLYRAAWDRYEACAAFGEPSMEVAGDGTIWYAAGGGVGTPIWTSRDGGRTFQYLTGLGTATPREAAPTIEGDFGIDAAGNAYFIDTGFATTAITSWTKAGVHRSTTAWPFYLIIDRPWVKGGAADEVYLVYFTKQSQFTKQPETEAFDTAFYASRDGGKTWPAQPLGQFPCAVGSLGKGPSPERVFVTACGTYWIPSRQLPTLWISDDAGRTWGRGEAIPLPFEEMEDAKRQIHPFINAVSDESGNIYAVYTHNLDADSNENAVFLSRRSPNGTWMGPWQVGPGGYNNLPWPAAGREGRIAIAWYHTDTPWKDEGNPNNTWFLMAAASIDAAGPAPHLQVAIPDPEPVLLGPRSETRLGHLLSTEITPDGRVAIAFARDVPSTGARSQADNLFVRSDSWVDLAPSRYPNGP